MNSFLCKPVQVGVSLTSHSTANVEIGNGSGVLERGTSKCGWVVERRGVPAMAQNLVLLITWW